ncbi:NADPH-dependent F420 reductase [Paraburkholderia kirstenboschensis]|uniref:NAD(P)-binding domain-containing protein n=1 Tax=Paraburkholderia kirstenboschensis TaxID=1245436 RepID=A0ABZ0E988_9BURK|nr:NAD(P)-binding domain-containing protein [Paraburkholderia kirstenboschensis]WOD13826.1 NAD(P)-binding domain-containing protein [Paraburkholderia kirstenboschensis]
MKIGFIGAGAVAQSIARSAIQAGHEVVLSARRGPQALGDIMAALGPNASADTVQEVAGLDLVVLAIPWLQVPSALDGLPNWAGRILVDTTNPFTQYEPRLILADLGDKGASEIVAAHAPAARVVKAFNAIRMEHFDKGPKFHDGKRVIFVSGDDMDAKAVVIALVREFGYAAVDLGGLVAGGRMQQAGGPIAGHDWVVA